MEDDQKFFLVQRGLAAAVIIRAQRTGKKVSGKKKRNDEIATLAASLLATLFSPTEETALNFPMSVKKKEKKERKKKMGGGGKCWEEVSVERCWTDRLRVE